MSEACSEPIAVRIMPVKLVPNSIQTDLMHMSATEISKFPQLLSTEPQQPGHDGKGPTCLIKKLIGLQDD